MGQDGRNYANYNLIWRPNPTVKYIGENENTKFSPTLCKYFTVSVFDISSGIYEQYFCTNIGMIVYVYVVHEMLNFCKFNMFHNVLFSI